jgi:hypothetical protein
MSVAAVDESINTLEHNIKGKINDEPAVDE